MGDGEMTRGRKKGARFKPKLTSAKYKQSTCSFESSTGEIMPCSAPENPEQSTESELSQIEPNRSEEEKPVPTGEVKATKPHTNDQKIA